MAIALLIAYGFFLLFIFAYSIIQLSLAFRYWRKHRILYHQRVPEMTGRDWPKVTVQLPVYNEYYVVERLIEAIAHLDYPKNKLEIQVLDDSNDESFGLAAKKVNYFAGLGIDIKHIKRPERTGYKAGALAYGLQQASGEFIAIFDADFIPEKDFLLKTIPHFYKSEKIGVVQTKWEHLNADYSLLTQLQAFGLDAHFSVEQVGRSAGGHFINFNGTAGVWRAKCIHDAGGWQSDTITEDLDLSYRAQLKGWEFIYLESVGAPAELPAEMNALKSQQYRWTKGAAECAVKNLPAVLKSGSIKASTKINAVFHLLNSFIFVCVLMTGILSVPLLLVKKDLLEFSIVFKIASVFLLSFLVLSFFYWLSRPESERKSVKGFLKFLVLFPMFLSISMGLSLHNAIAVIEGYLGRKTAFVRTPKFALQRNTDKWSGNKYRAIRVNPLIIFEIILTVYFGYGIYLAFVLQDYGLLPFHIMLVIGYGYISLYSLLHSKVR
jgi:cellulose synthase/poly-beta-1,6-N-acetylglucosamine synthase-like glycosyltransferase